MSYELINADCLQAMKTIPDNSIDLILCDPPYGVTSIGWDQVIPLQELWPELKRVTKQTAPIVLFSSGLFTVDLINSNRSMFKYKLVWEKNVPTGMSSARFRPMKYYEEICVFAKGKHTYNPILKPRVGVGKDCYNYEHYCGKNNHVELEKKKIKYDPDWVQPSDIIKFNVVPNRKGKLHSTQKPVDLCEYLVKTYSNEDDTVLDFTMGSGSTGIACLNTNRNFVGIELDKGIFNIAEKRMEKHIC